MSSLKIKQIVRDPSDPSLTEEYKIPREIREVHESLPPPCNYPFFLVDFSFKEKDYQMKFGLEIEGRDAEWDEPTDINSEDLMLVTDEILTSIYASKPWKDAVESLENAPPEFWQ